MSTRLALIACLLVGLLGADLSAQGRRNTGTNPGVRSRPQEKRLQERDPDLYQWIDTLITNLQKDHKRIRNSAAQALIAVGSEAGPQLMELRDRVTPKERRIVTRILERITRGTGRNLFKTDAGGKDPKSLAGEFGNVLKLKKPQVEKLEVLITKIQEKKRGNDRALRRRKINGPAHTQQAMKLHLDTEAELGQFLDKVATDYILQKLSLKAPSEQDRKRGNNKDSTAGWEEKIERRNRNKETGGK